MSPLPEASPVGVRAIVNGEARQVLGFQRTGFLAALVVAATLPLSGPAAADPEMIQIPVATVAASAQAAEAELPAPVTPAPAIETPAFQPIKGGMASFYGRELAGARTASGQRFDPAGLTAAHRTLPLGTRVQVTNPRTGDSVIVTINDRGPFHSNRVIDLSEAAARQIGIVRAGSGMVQLAVLSPDN